MPKAKIPRNLSFNPEVVYFKPQGVPLRFLNEVVIMSDEIEALKLYEVDNLSQIEASKKMKVSQPTFARIYGHAVKKIATALIKGMAISVKIK